MPGFSHGSSLDLVKVAFVLIIFMLTAVFKYGALEEFGRPENMPTLEGKRMTMMLAPIKKK